MVEELWRLCRVMGRHIAIDVEIGGTLLRVASLHATPAASKGPASKGVGALKPCFHRRIAEWMATWELPFLFGVDANAPGRESLNWDHVEMTWPGWVPGDPAEGDLIGRPEVVLHRARDLWREWLDSSAGASDRALVPSDGPLARSHQLRGGEWVRYDHLWATPEVRLVDMAYRWDLAVSDHALIEATLQL